MTRVFDLLDTPITEGTTLIEASAGTGKTYAITAVLLRLLLEKKVDELGEIDTSHLEVPDNFYDSYEGRPGAAAQELEINDMYLSYDLKLERIVAGCIAEGLHRYPSVRLYALSMPSNHCHQICGGEPVDFVRFHLQDGWEWPTFNFADATITVGVVLLLLDGLLAKQPTEGGESRAADAGQGGPQKTS